MSAFDKPDDKLPNQEPGVDGDAALASLVGEGKKYATVADLAKAYVHADAHIANMTSENNTLRQQLTSASKVDELLAKLEQSNAQPKQEPLQPTGEGEHAEKPEDVFGKMYDQRRADEQRESNVKRVSDELERLFGNKAFDAISAKEKQLGVNLQELSATSPELVLSLFQGAQPSQQPPQSREPFGGDPTRKQSGFDLNTRSGIEAAAKAQGWSRTKKYATLNSTYARADAGGWLDKFNS